ncbi:MAG: type I restriction-modification system subunit M N-terminal domain-containing protein [Burkholderiales bacterium]
MTTAGWVVQNGGETNFHAAHDVGIREFPLLQIPSPSRPFFAVFGKRRRARLSGATTNERSTGAPRRSTTQSRAKRMAKPSKEKTSRADQTATVGYEAQLWQMADALRGSMDAAEYKHVCLGLLFLKYISDAFEEKHAALLAERTQGADPEDPDEYRAQSIFWVPPEARWSCLKAQARQPAVGQRVDDAHGRD